MNQNENIKELSLADRRAISKIMELLTKINATLEHFKEEEALENFEKWVKANKTVLAYPSLSNLICEYNIEQGTRLLR